MPKKPKVVVFGAGGHSKVVLDVLERTKRYAVVGLLDNSVDLHGTTRWGYKVIGGRDQFIALQKRGVTRLIVALGDNRERQSMFDEAVKAGFELVSAIHPSAQLGKGVVIGPGSLLVAGTVVNVDAQIGANVIVNTGATVDHDCRIGAHAHISPGAHLAGNVTVGELTHIGIGAVVLPNLTIGWACIVGAGAVVRESVPDGVVVAGNPARPIRSDEESRGI
jgi:sugar O-acyltransferase (sialic acid O-acetyltransferase NeuD family)